MRLRPLIIIVLFFVASSLLANDIVAPESFSKDITIVSLNPTWNCGPCRANDNELNSLVDSLQSELSIEAISLNLTGNELRTIFFTVEVPTTLIYKGDRLIEVVKGLHSDTDYAGVIGFSLANYKKMRDKKSQKIIDQFEESFRQYIFNQASR